MANDCEMPDGQFPWKRDRSDVLPRIETSRNAVIIRLMAKKGQAGTKPSTQPTAPPRAGKPSSLLDTRVIYCGDNLEQLAKLPETSVDLIYIDPPFNSNRNYEVFWGETKEKRVFEDRHASTAAYIDYMRPRCVQLARVRLKSQRDW
jgi:hypothetical protein